MRRVIVFIWFLFWLVAGFAYGQEVPECQKLLEDYISNNAKLPKPDVKRSYYVVTQQKIYSFEGQLMSTSGSEMIMTGDGIFYESESVSLYQDSVYSFLIIHPAKTIVWRNTSQVQGTESVLDYSLAQTTLLSRGKVIACSDVNTDKGNQRKIVFEVDKDYKALYKTDKIEFYYDLSKQQVVRQIVYYTKQKGYWKADLEYVAQDYASKKKIKPAKTYVLTAGSALLEKYKSYEFLDKRAK